MASLSSSRYTHHLAGSLLENFLEGIVPFRYWYIHYPNEKTNKYNIVDDWDDSLIKKIILFFSKSDLYIPNLYQTKQKLFLYIF